MRSRRLKVGYPTKRALWHASRIHEKTLGKLEMGQVVGSDTLGTVELYLRWEPGSAESILSGGEPRELDVPPRSAGPELFDDVERKIWSALEAIEELSEEERLLYLDLHRARKQRSVKGQTG